MKWLNAENFKKEIIDDKKVKHCVIEVIKDHCPACFQTKFNCNVLSLKMAKNGISDLMPFYRMKISNEIPWLGEFPHSPILFYVKKEGKDIVEISKLSCPFVSGNKTEIFLNELKNKLNNVEFSSKIKIDAMGQYKMFLNK